MSCARQDACGPTTTVLLLQGIRVFTRPALSTPEGLAHQPRRPRSIPAAAAFEFAAAGGSTSRRRPSPPRPPPSSFPASVSELSPPAPTAGWPSLSVSSGCWESHKSSELSRPAAPSPLAMRFGGWASHSTRCPPRATRSHSCGHALPHSHRLPTCSSQSWFASVRALQPDEAAVLAKARWGPFLANQRPTKPT